MRLAIPTLSPYAIPLLMIDATIPDTRLSNIWSYRTVA